MAEFADQRVAGTAVSQDVSHEEESAARPGGSNGTEVEPAMPPVPRESSAHESAHSDPHSVTAAPAAVELAVELPPTKQDADHAAVTPAATQSTSPYLAAGVLPFCILGGDLLFLLGQQLRFRSRVNGKGSSSSETSGVSTPAVQGEGWGASAAPTKKEPYSGAAPPVRRPRRGPIPKVSLSGSSLSGQPRTDASPLSPSAAAAHTTAHTNGEQAGHEAALQLPVDVGSGTEHGMWTDVCQMPPQEEHRTGVPPAGGDNGAAGEHPATTAVMQENGLDIWRDPPPAPNDPAIPPPGGLSTTVLPEGSPSVAAVTAGESLPWRKRSAGEPGEGTVPAGLLWSDFGGAKEADDVDAEETASREFAEESFGIFNGVRLDSDSVARSQAAMSSALRDPSLRGKRVFESRNGGYTMFCAEVGYVPDLMMNLARKEIVGADVSGSGAGSVESDCGESGEGRASPLGFSEKTDFAWVPALVLRSALENSRNRSTRKVVVKLGGCRYLRLFHKFVISLWGLDLAAVIQAASTPLRVRKPSLPPPRILLLKSNAEAPSRRERNKQEAGGKSDDDTTAGGTSAAIRGIDCVRPSFLSGRKRTSLGIIEGRRDRRWDSGDGSGSRAGSEDEAGREVGASGRNRGGDGGGGGCSGGRGGGGAEDGVRKSRSRKSGAACRKRRRQCKQARRFKAAAKAEAAAAAVAAAAGIPSTEAVLPVVAVVGDV